MKKIIITGTGLALAGTLLISSAVDAQTRSRGISDSKKYKEMGIGLLLNDAERSIYKDIENMTREAPEGFKFLNENNDGDTEGADNKDGTGAPDTSYFEPIEDGFKAYDEKRYQDAIKILLPWARKDNADAQEILGLIYKFGYGVEKNNEQAILWLQKAADQNKPIAQHHIGVMLFTGEGMPQNSIEALKWLYIAVSNYKDGDLKKRASQDRDNVRVRLTRRDAEKAKTMAQSWLIDYQRNKKLKLDEETEGKK